MINVKLETIAIAKVLDNAKTVVLQFVHTFKELKIRPTQKSITIIASMLAHVNVPKSTVYVSFEAARVRGSSKLSIISYPLY
jgi:hypothetical protein